MNYMKPYRDPFSLAEELFERSFSQHPMLWGDVQRTGDTVRFKEGDELTVEVDLPGVPKDKTTVTIEGKVVSIEGTRKVIHKGGESEETYNRSFSVSNQYNAEKGKAEQRDGVLTLTFPKTKTDSGGKKVLEIK